MTRDMTRAQFAEACKRNQLRLSVLWLEDLTREGRMYGLIVRRDGKVMRRASIAWALKQRAKDNHVSSAGA